MKFEFSRHMFEKFSYIKFHENPSRGSRIFQSGRTDRHDKKIVACSNLANAPEKRPERADKIDTWAGFIGLGLGSIGVLL
jgi:hypothetical protein